MDWIAKLNVGDDVAILRGGWSRSFVIAPVTRITASWIIAGGTKYRKANGREVGSPYGSFLTEATESVRAEIHENKRRHTALGRVLDVKWRDMPTDTIEAVLAVMDESARATNAVDPVAQSTTD